MKRKLFVTFIALCLLISLMPSMRISASAADTWRYPPAAPTAFTLGVDGTTTNAGTALNPYAISSAQALANLAYLVNSGNGYTGKYFRITTSIVLNDNVLTSDGMLNDAGSLKEWTTIGNYSKHFYGSIDGDGHTISGIYINKDSDYKGLFGYLENATIKDLGIEDSYIKGKNCVGGFASKSENSTIQNCHFSGALYGDGIVGGITGYSSNSTIENCYNTASIDCDEDCAGITAYNISGGSIKFCYNAGAVNNSSHGGGIVSYNGATVQYCYNIGMINSESSSGCNAGGIAAWNSTGGVIENCYNNGEIIASTNWGSIGPVVGGIVGNCTSAVRNCFNTGKIKSNFESLCGSIIGCNSGSITDCFYDKQMSPTGGVDSSDVTGATGKSTSEMTTKTPFTASWDSGAWTFSSGLYPRLSGYVDVDTDYQMDVSNAALLHATPVYLAGSETVAGILSDFTLSTDNGVSWTSGDESVISISGNNATINNKGNNIVLEASLGGLQKRITILSINLFSATYSASTKTDGSVPTDSSLYRPGDTFAVADSGTLTRTGYTFVGWENDSTIYSSKDNYTVGSTDITFNAVWKPDAPTLPSLENKTHTTIKVSSVSGQQYSKDRGRTWQTNGTFSGLTPNTSYDILTRVSASGYDVASEPSAALTITTKQIAAAVPLDPTLESKTNSTITITAINGQEYSIDGGETWQDSGLFSGLTSSTNYSILTRIKETDSAMPSAVGAVLDVMTKQSAGEAPAAPVLESKTNTSITVIVESNQEYNINGGAWQDDGTFSPLSPNTEYTICTRKKETDSALASEISAALEVETEPNPSFEDFDTESGSAILVNGKTVNGGKVEVTQVNGKTLTTVTLDEVKLNQRLADESIHPVITVPFSENAGTSAGVLTGQMVKNMEDKEATLEIKTNAASYALPASQIDIDSVAKQFGEAVCLSDVQVAVTIAEPGDDTVSIVENASQNGGFTIMVQPVEFTVTCSYQGNDAKVNNFEAYVNRSVRIPDGVNSEKITTAVVVEPNGTTRHVPTKITIVDGVYYAVINSLTNSVYTLINHNAELEDINSHWARESINDMASRLIITGYGDGTFKPDANITRAEFATIVVRALGISKSQGEGEFNDVSSSDWYCGYIKAAVSYGLITGYSDGNFRPNEMITREQAMVIIARAMKITELRTDITDSQIIEQLQGYSDASVISEYAKIGAALCTESGIISGRENRTLSPKEAMTRAEVAVVVERLLKQSKLI